MKKILLFFFLLSFTACTIENNPGPVGPPGPPGNANVISTEIITLNTWVYNSSQKWYSAEIDMPEITQDIANSGLVMVYQQISGGANPIWIPLPDSFANVTTNYDFTSGSIVVYSFNIDNTTPIAPTGMKVRVVVIPDSFRKTNPNANWNNFEETQEILNLQN